MRMEGDACVAPTKVAEMEVLFVGARHASPCFNSIDADGGRRASSPLRRSAKWRVLFVGARHCLALFQQHRCGCRGTHASPLRRSPRMESAVCRGEALPRPVSTASMRMEGDACV